MSLDLDQKIKQLPGPILVLGASGFVGANLFRRMLAVREDVWGTSSRPGAWRLEGLREDRVVSADLLVERNLAQLIATVRPATVLDCVAYGAYSFEKDPGLIFRTNVDYVVRLVGELAKAGVQRYIHAGSSSEYGESGAGPAEQSFLKPNSAYAASKAAAAQFLYYMGKKHAFPCANLRLYSVYGPWEDSSRLVPALLAKGAEGGYPPLVDPAVSRDFVYADDACEAFVDAALSLQPSHYGESFNIGSGAKTTVGQLASLSQALFKLPQAPDFGQMPKRSWDLEDWYADPAKAKAVLGWQARTPLADGLARSAAWYQGLRDKALYQKVSKKFGKDPVYSVSVIVACRDNAAKVPQVYAGVKAVLERLNLHHEVILVDDGSADGTREAILALSAGDRSVLGLSHSRPFGTSSAFRSGMQASTCNACVLLDGRGEDPPQLIEAFVAKWKEGYDVAYGLPDPAQDPWLLRAANSVFYKVFDRFSYIRLPRNAGDFSLMEKRVVQSLLRFPERDLFIRGVRAFAGFKQVAVPYQRTAGSSRGLGRLWRSLGPAKRGILAFSTAPLSLLSFSGFTLFGLSVLLALSQVLIKLLDPSRIPSGITTTLITIIFFGSLNLLGLAVLGEYLATVFEEVKRRPHAIVSQVLKDGEQRAASMDTTGKGAA